MSSVVLSPAGAGRFGGLDPERDSQRRLPANYILSNIIWLTLV